MEKSEEYDSQTNPVLHSNEPDIAAGLDRAALKRRLFRQEVEASVRSSWLGEVRIISPISHTIWAFSAVFCALILLIWLAVGEFTRRERVDGLLVSSKGMLSAKTRHSGQVGEIYVRVGQSVASGDPLISVTADQYTKAATALGDQVRSELTIQQRTIEADIRSTKLIASIKRESLVRQVNLVKEQIRRATSAYEIYENDVRDQRALVARFESLLAQGYISAAEVQRFRSAAASAEATMIRQLSERGALEQQLKSLEVELARAPIEENIALGSAKREISRVAIDKNLSDGVSTSVIRSPADGVVTKIMIHQGDNVDQGRALVAIMPRGSILEAEFFVPSSAVGLMQSGSRVSVRYPAFPYQKFGTQSGHVLEISKGAYTPEEMSESFGISNATAPRYRIRVGLDREQKKGSWRELRLSPGMAAQADIEIETRPLYQWIFIPARALASR